MEGDRRHPQAGSPSSSRPVRSRQDKDSMFGVLNPQPDDVLKVPVGSQQHSSAAPSNLREFHGQPDVLLDYDTVTEDSSDDREQYQYPITTTSKPHSEELRSPNVHVHNARSVELRSPNYVHNARSVDEDHEQQPTVGSQYTMPGVISSLEAPGPSEPYLSPSESDQISESPPETLKTSDQSKHAVQGQHPRALTSTSRFSFSMPRDRLRINTWPVPARIHIKCRYCNQVLVVPPNLGPSETGVQKLRCGSCRKVSRYRLNHLLEPRGKEKMVAIEFPFTGHGKEKMVAIEFPIAGQASEPSRTSPPSPTSQDVASSSDRQQKKTSISPDGNPTRRHKFRKGLKRILIKISVKVTKGKKATQYGRRVVVNGQPVPDDVVRRVEEYAGVIQPGSYWYDYRAGFWGVMGGPCLGMIPVGAPVVQPFIEELNFPLARNCSNGKTGVLVNGRELPHKDLQMLKESGLPGTPGKAYNVDVDIDGRLTEETTGMELKGLGRLTPMFEQTGRGSGMWVPDNQSSG